MVKKFFLVGLLLLLIPLASAINNGQLDVYYSLEETAGTVVEDVRSGLFNATNTGATININGIIGKSYFFDGTNDAIDLPNKMGLFRDGEWAINMWFNTSGMADNDMVFSSKGEVVLEANVITQNRIRLEATGTGGSKNAISGSLINDTWYMLTFTQNASGLNLFINGKLNATSTAIGVINANVGNSTLMVDATGTRFLEGMLDEISFWNNTLTTSEIVELYNGGAGLGYPFSAIITLDQPEDRFFTSDASENVTFNATVISDPYDMDNATLHIWYNNNSIYRTNFTTLTGTTNVSEWNLTNFGFGTYKWNVELCYNTGTCEWAVSNRTFYASNITEAYSPILVEGQSTGLEMNITFTGIDTSILSALYWNNTKHIPTKNVIGTNKVNFVATLTVPVGTGNLTGTNISHYWNYYFPDGSFDANTTNGYQTVYSVGVDNCSIYTDLIYNFSLLDEETRITLNGTIDVDLEISNLFNTVSLATVNYTVQNVNSTLVCINAGILGNTSVKADGVISYVSPDYVQEFYFIDNETVSSVSHINLHDLLAVDSTSFLFSFIDTDGLRVEEAIVHVDRKYVGDGVFREVERAKTDESGETHVHLVEEDVIYRFRITKGGTLLYTSAEYQAKCLSTPCEIELKATGDFFDFYEDYWDGMEGGYYFVTLNGSSRQISLSFVSNSTAYLNMNLTAYQYVGDGRTIVASNSLNATTGTITLTIPVIFGNETFAYAVYKDNELIVWGWFDLVQKGTDYFGNTLGLILSAFILLTLGLMAVTEGVAVVIFLVLGLVIAGVLRLIDLGWVSLISLVLAGGILVWKLTNRRSRK